MILFFATEEKLQDISSFFADHPIPFCGRVIQESLEEIKWKSNWLSRDLSKIKSFLTENV